MAPAADPAARRVDDALRRCLFCGHDVDCREAEPGADFVPTDCPNARFFAAHGELCRGDDDGA